LRQPHRFANRLLAHAVVADDDHAVENGARPFGDDVDADRRGALVVAELRPHVDRGRAVAVAVVQIPDRVAIGRIRAKRARELPKPHDDGPRLETFGSGWNAERRRAAIVSGRRPPRTKLGDRGGAGPGTRGSAR